MSRLHFFDMASVFNSDSKQTKEMVSINKSILTLSRCFKSLVENNKNKKKPRNSSYVKGMFCLCS